MDKTVIDLKAMVGKAYFSDGHTETIYQADVRSEDDITFYTETGKYYYRAYAEPLEKEQLYCDNDPRILMVPKYVFLKAIVDTTPSIGWRDSNAYKESWAPTDIDKIELEKKDYERMDKC